MDGRVRRSLVVRLWLGNISEGLIPSVPGVRVSNKLMSPSANTAVRIRRSGYGSHVACSSTAHKRTNVHGDLPNEAGVAPYRAGRDNRKDPRGRFLLDPIAWWPVRRES